MSIDDVLYDFALDAREPLAMKRDGEYVTEPGSQPQIELMRLLAFGLIVPPYFATPIREAYNAWLRSVAEANDISDWTLDQHIPVPKVPYVEGAYPEYVHRDWRSGMFSSWASNTNAVLYERDWTVMSLDQALKHLATERLTIDRHHTCLDSPTRALEWMQKLHPDWYREDAKAA